MRIRFEELTAEKSGGGIEVAISGLIAALQNEDVEVSRLTKTRKFFAEEKPDCAHFHGLWSPSLAKRFLAWQRQGVPCVWSPHGMLEPWAFAHKRWKKKIAWVLYQQSLMNRAATLHATSAREAENLQRLGLRSKIEVIPWGISTPSCDFNRSASQHSCSSKRTALFVGRIHPIKALAVLVAAWEAVRPSGWRMKLVGPDEGGHQIELEKQVRQAGLEEDFEFVGPMDRAGVQEAYQCADLFILPSHAENFGFVVGEALGFGLPVIASQGVPWEILAKKGAGWWVEGTAKGIGKALREATDCSTERLHFIGAEGRRLVEQRYSWQSVGHSFARLYQKLSRNK